MIKLIYIALIKTSRIQRQMHTHITILTTLTIHIKGDVNNTDKYVKRIYKLQWGKVTGINY